MSNDIVKATLGTVLDVAIASIRNGKVENALGILIDVRRQLTQMELETADSNRSPIILPPGGMKHG